MKKQSIDEKLEAKLSSGIICFSYRTVKGEIRYAAGTQDMSLIPTEQKPKTPFKVGGKTIAYYDFAKQGVRSLVRTNVIRIAAAINK